jgi:hypothetical protein
VVLLVALHALLELFLLIPGDGIARIAQEVIIKGPLANQHATTVSLENSPHKLVALQVVLRALRALLRLLLEAGTVLRAHRASIRGPLANQIVTTVSLENSPHKLVALQVVLLVLRALLRLLLEGGTVLRAHRASIRGPLVNQLAMTVSLEGILLKWAGPVALIVTWSIQVMLAQNIANLQPGTIS